MFIQLQMTINLFLLIYWVFLTVLYTTQAQVLIGCEKRDTTKGSVPQRNKDKEVKIVDIEKMPQTCQVNSSENINFVRHKTAHTISCITHIRGRRYSRLMLIVNPAGRGNRHAENALVINYHAYHPLTFSRPCRSDKSIQPLLLPIDYRMRFSDHPCFSDHIAANAKHPWLQQNHGPAWPNLSP